MNQVARIRLERVARNLPIAGSPKFRRAKTGNYEVLLAFGRSKEGQWHGVWGAEIGERGIGRTSEAGSAMTEKAFIQGMFDDAVWFCREADKRHMMDEGWWTSARA